MNADKVVAGVGQDVKGYNLYVYCFNNPVNMSDPTGGWPKWVTDIQQNVSDFANDVSEDIRNFDIKNESESKVLESNYISFYKGVPVFRTNMDRSGSFGALFIARGEKDEDIVRHEKGHTKQLQQLGVVKYALCIFIPSALEWSDKSYYDRPWEVTADVYGDVQRRQHSQEDIDNGFSYLRASKIMGPLIWIFIE